MLYGMALGCLVAAFGIYPAVVLYLCRTREDQAPRRVLEPELAALGVSIVLTARDEPEAVARRAPELIRRLVELGVDGELIVATDGLSGETARVARTFASALMPVTAVQAEPHAGRAATAAAGCRAARHDVVVMAEARHAWSADALRRLVATLSDPTVGAVGGRIVGPGQGAMSRMALRAKPPAADRFRWGWGDDDWLAQHEEKLGAAIEIETSICAVRRNLFEPMARAGDDDTSWPARVVLQGYRLASEPHATAAEDGAGDGLAVEFTRRVRRLAGRLTLVATTPETLSPWRCAGWYAAAGRLLRLAAPWAWGAAYVGGISDAGTIATATVAVQTAVMVVGLVGLSPAFAHGSALAWKASAFVLENAAAWLASLVGLGLVASRAAAAATERLRAPRGRLLELDNPELVRGEPAK